MPVLRGLSFFLLVAFIPLGCLHLVAHPVGQRGARVGEAGASVAGGVGASLTGVGVMSGTGVGAGPPFRGVEPSGRLPCAKNQIPMPPPMMSIQTSNRLTIISGLFVRFCVLANSADVILSCPGIGDHPLWRADAGETGEGGFTHVNCDAWRSAWVSVPSLFSALWPANDSMNDIGTVAFGDVFIGTVS